MADEIRTTRLLLRRAAMADAPAMHRIMSDPRAMRYWSTPPHDGLAQTEAWLRAMVEADPDPATSDDFIVTLGSRLIGKLGAWRLPEIGFLIDPAEWGHGFAGEALGAFIDRRRALGSAELTADVDPRNAASLALLTRHGFTETNRAERTFQVGDEWCDSVYLALAL